MAAAQKLYPRATLKKIVKAHSKRNLSKNVDVLVGINNASPLHKATYANDSAADIPGLCPVPRNSLLSRWVAAANALMKEAGINAKQAGERGISAKSVKKVTEVWLPPQR
ncbi:Histone-fold domain-containing new1 protein [Rutstroemia sp. NJR-2017a WRK4]|nr:Histone-fold domain-containing new1 protein [Rutstroemia sp. NJR-2017a WRK4]